MEDSNTLINKFRSSNDPKTHTILRIAEDLIVKIDRELAQKLGIKDGDKVSETEDGTNTIRLVFNSIKNRSRMEVSQQPINQDYGGNQLYYNTHLAIFVTIEEGCF